MLEPDNRLAFFACKFCRSRYNSGYFLQFNLHGRGGGIQSHSLTIQASNASQMRHGEAQALRQTTGGDDLILANVILEGCSHWAVHIQHVKTTLTHLRTAEDCPSTNADRAGFSTRHPLPPASHRPAAAG